MIKKAEHIVRTLTHRGHQAYFVGGCVRDILMGRESRDIDIVTSCRPEEVCRIFPVTIPVGAKFGVILVRHEGESFEVATFRSDRCYIDGRRPTGVEFSTREEDVKRRDFTVNAMLYDPESKSVIDLKGGREDLEAGIIRAVGDPGSRFDEDKLRMLRAVRFAAELDFTLEPETYRSITQIAHRITDISMERISDELQKMFTGPRPARALSLLDQTGLLEPLLPEVAALKGVEQPKAFHPEGDVWKHTQLCFEKADPPLSVTLSFAVLFHDIGKPSTFEVADRIRFNHHDRVGARMAAGICRRLKMSSRETQRIEKLVEKHIDFMNVQKMRESTLKRFLLMDNFSEHLELHRIDCQASHNMTENVDFCKRKLKEFEEEFNAPELPPPLLNGNDIMDLGVEEGPAVGRIKDQMLDAQLEGRIKTRHEAEAFVRGKLKS